jgi:hypothetical protein
VEEVHCKTNTSNSQSHASVTGVLGPRKCSRSKSTQCMLTLQEMIFSTLAHSTVVSVVPNKLTAHAPVPGAICVPCCPHPSDLVRREAVHASIVGVALQPHQGAAFTASTRADNLHGICCQDQLAKDRHHRYALDRLALFGPHTRTVRPYLAAMHMVVVQVVGGGPGVHHEIVDRVPISHCACQAYPIHFSSGWSPGRTIKLWIGSLPGSVGQESAPMLHPYCAQHMAAEENTMSTLISDHAEK